MLQTQTGEAAVRVVVRASTHITWPDEFTMRLGRDTNSIRDVTMLKTECTDCRGSGKVKLFVSEAECDRCLGYGYYAEGKDWDNAPLSG